MLRLISIYMIKLNRILTSYIEFCKVDDGKHSNLLNIDYSMRQLRMNSEWSLIIYGVSILTNH